jgi:YesN/AraC family two-component response regulator
MVRSVLIVDDEKDIREILRAEFEYHKFLIQEAENGVQALKIFKVFPTDVVISDLRMPIMDGKDFLKNIKKVNSHIPPFYFISGYPDLKHEEAVALGAMGLFTKPFQLKELVKKIVEDFRTCPTPQENLK